MWIKEKNNFRSFTKHPNPKKKKKKQEFCGNIINKGIGANICSIEKANLASRIGIGTENKLINFQSTHTKKHFIV